MRRRVRFSRGVVLALCILLVGRVPLAAQEPEQSVPSSLILPAASEHDSALRTAIVLTIAGNAFDGATTVVGILGGRKRETNPVLGGHPARIIALKTLLTVPQVLAERHLVNAGHPKIAKALGFAVAGFASTIALHNLGAGAWLDGFGGRGQNHPAAGQFSPGLTEGSGSGLETFGPSLERP
jgi:hypothetical protein